MLSKRVLSVVLSLVHGSIVYASYNREAMKRCNHEAQKHETPHFYSLLLDLQSTNLA